MESEKQLNFRERKGIGDEDSLMYKNPNYKKVRGSHILMVSCGHCKTDIVKYQKKGRGNLLRLHINRIIESEVDFSKHLNCPSCDELIGTKITLKRGNKEVYKMIRSNYNTREVDQ